MPTDAFRRKQVRAWAATNPVERSPGNGCVVLAPPGSGKSYFVAHHKNNRWADEDEFLGGYLRFHTEDWRAVGSAAEEHYRECDRYLEAMRAEGLKVVGSLFWDIVPEAVVLLPEPEHRQFVAKRQDLEWKDALKVRRFLEKLCSEQLVPRYSDWAALDKALGHRALNKK